MMALVQTGRDISPTYSERNPSGPERGPKIQGDYRCLLVAPADIALVWHAHMLSPRNYEADCTAIVGGIVDHKLLAADEWQTGQRQQVGQRIFPNHQTR